MRSVIQSVDEMMGNRPAINGSLGTGTGRATRMGKLLIVCLVAATSSAQQYLVKGIHYVLGGEGEGACACNCFMVR